MLVRPFRQFLSRGSARAALGGRRSHRSYVSDRTTARTATRIRYKSTESLPRGIISPIARDEFFLFRGTVVGCLAGCPCLAAFARRGISDSQSIVILSEEWSLAQRPTAVEGSLHGLRRLRGVREFPPAQGLSSRGERRFCARQGPGLGAPCLAAFARRGRFPPPSRPLHSAPRCSKDAAREEVHGHAVDPFSATNPAVSS
jgi:hypothetical protein